MKMRRRHPFLGYDRRCLPPRGGAGSTRRHSRSVFDRHERGKEGESGHVAILLRGAESWDLWGLHNLKLSFVEAVKNMSSHFGWKRDLQLPMPLSCLVYTHTHLGAVSSLGTVGQRIPRHRSHFSVSHLPLTIAYRYGLLKWPLH